MKYCIAACSALLVLGSVTTAPATTINSNAGTTGFNFLKIDFQISKKLQKPIRLLDVFRLLLLT